MRCDECTAPFTYDERIIEAWRVTVGRLEQEPVAGDAKKVYLHLRCASRARGR